MTKLHALLIILLSGAILAQPDEAFTTQQHIQQVTNLSRELKAVDKDNPYVSIIDGLISEDRLGATADILKLFGASVNRADNGNGLSISINPFSVYTYLKTDSWVDYGKDQPQDREAVGQILDNRFKNYKWLENIQLSAGVLETDDDLNLGSGAVRLKLASKRSDPFWLFRDRLKDKNYIYEAKDLFVNGLIAAFFPNGTNRPLPTLGDQTVRPVNSQDRVNAVTREQFKDLLDRNLNPRNLEGLSIVGLGPLVSGLLEKFAEPEKVADLLNGVLISMSDREVEKVIAEAEKIPVFALFGKITENDPNQHPEYDDMLQYGLSYQQKFNIFTIAAGVNRTEHEALDMVMDPALPDLSQTSISFNTTGTVLGASFSLEGAFEIRDKLEKDNIRTTLTWSIPLRISQLDNLSVAIPISVTYNSESDQIMADHLRGNLGFTLKPSVPLSRKK